MILTPEEDTGQVPVKFCIDTASDSMEMEISNAPWRMEKSYLRDEMEQSIPRKCPDGQTHKQL